MKFNKSTESDFWYVEGDDGFCLGTIFFHFNRLVFEANSFSPKLQTTDMLRIAITMQEIEYQLGIDKTSTFKSNSQ